MPIYEFNCKRCKKDFEELMHKNNTCCTCPHCGSEEAAKKLSVFGVKGAAAGGTCPPSCQKGSCSSCG